MYLKLLEGGNDKMRYLRVYIYLFSIIVIFSCASNTQRKDLPGNISSEEDPAQKIAQNIIANINKLPNRRVAVADFTDIEGNEITEGKLIAEQIITYLAQNTNVKVIERKQLNKVLAEQKLTMLGLTESDNVQKVGKLLNVDGIVSGTIAYLEDTKEINARMIEVNTGLILCAVPVKMRQRHRGINMESLPPEERERLKREIEDREQERKKDPELFRLKVQHQRDLMRLRERNPKMYFRVVKTIRRMEMLKQENPRMFLLVTEPPNSPKISRLKRRNPELYRRVKKLRKTLKFITDKSPAYLQKLLHERREIKKRLR